MRIRASYTIENSIIIPFFTLIIVTLISLSFYMHDTIIIKNAAFQTAVKLEQKVADMTAKEYDVMEQTVSDYIEEKTIFSRDVNVHLQKGNKESWCTCNAVFVPIGFLQGVNRIEKTVRVRSNHPPDFIRFVNAVEKLR